MAIKKAIKTVKKKKAAAVTKKTVNKTITPKKVAAKKVVKPKTNKVKTEKHVYSEKDIKTYEGVKAVQKRQEMYVGIGQQALWQLFYEIFSNSMDEALAEFCNKIDIVIETNGSMIISDNGRGLPYKNIKHKGKTISAAEQSCTSLHSGGKMDNSSYRISGGTNGLRIAVVKLF
jgi:DNA gyrase subunit B